MVRSVELPESTRFTKLIYHAIDLYSVVEDDRGERRCIASRCIPASTVILLEHLAAFPVSGMSDAAAVLLSDPELTLHLCPRGEHDPDRGIEAKLQLNSFNVPARGSESGGGGWHPDLAVTGLHTSMFNHDTPPNAHCDFMPALMGSSTPDSQSLGFWIAVVFTLCDIEIGDEIFINYGNGYAVQNKLQETEPALSRDIVKGSVDSGIQAIMDAGLTGRMALAIGNLGEYMGGIDFQQRMASLLPLLQLSESDEGLEVWCFLLEHFDQHLSVPEV